VPGFGGAKTGPEGSRFCLRFILKRKKSSQSKSKS
jgi:hypothetical protein